MDKSTINEQGGRLVSLVESSTKIEGNIIPFPSIKEPSSSSYILQRTIPVYLLLNNSSLKFNSTTDSVKFLGVFQTNHLILLIQCEDTDTIVILELNNDSVRIVKEISLHRFLLISSTLKLMDIKSSGEFIFVLDSASIVHIINATSFSLKGTVPVLDYWIQCGQKISHKSGMSFNNSNSKSLSSSTNSNSYSFCDTLNYSVTNSNSLLFNSIAISSDLLCLIVGDINGYVISINLDIYFKQFTTVEQSSVSHSSYSYWNQLNSSFSITSESNSGDLLHWYETDVNLNTPILKPNKNLNNNKTWNSFSTSTTTAKANYAVNGFTLKPSSQHNAPSDPETASSYNPTISPASDVSLEDKKLADSTTVSAQEASPVSSNQVASDCSLLCPILDAGNSTLQSLLVSSQLIITLFDNDDSINFYDRRTGIHVRFQFMKQTLLLSTKDNFNFYWISSEGLQTLLTGNNLDQTKLLNNLIMLESTQLASSLCELNNWDRRSLGIHAIELGLRYRQLDVIQPALDNLHRDQWNQATDLLLDYISNTISLQELEFIANLIHISISFVTGIIQDLVSKIQSSKNADLLPCVNEWKQTSKLAEILEVNQLYYFSNTISILRKFESQLEESQKNNTPQKPSIRKSSSFLSPRTRAKELTKTSNIILKPRNLFDSSSNEGSIEELAQSISDDSYNFVEDDVIVDTEFKRTSSKDKTTNLEGIPLQFGIVQEQWDSLDEIDIIKDSLSSGLVSLALSFLLYRRERGARNTGTLDYLGTSHSMFQDFKRVCYCLIYQQLAYNQIDTAVKMLQNLGENVAENLLEVYMNTGRRDIRHKLFDYLVKNTNFSENSMELINFVNTIESAYPSSIFQACYSVLLANATMNNSSFLPVGYFIAPNIDHSQDEEELIITSARETDDLTPTVQKSYGFTSLNIGSERNRILIPSINTSTANINGESYLYTSLNWVALWDAETKYRIILEKQPLNSTTSTEAFDANNFTHKLKYLVSHNDWKELIAAIQFLNISGTINEDAKLVFDSPSKDISDLLYLLPSVSILCTPFMKDILCNEFAKFGIFLDIEDIRLKENFNILVKRLIQANLLFVSNSDRFCTHFLPKKRFSLFHEKFVHYCAENDLHHLLYEYIQYYELPKDIEKWKSMDLYKLDKSAAKLLLNFNSHEDLVEASFLNSQLILKTTFKPSISNMLKSGHSFMAFSTLLLNRTSFAYSMNTDLNNILYLDRNLVKDFLKLYPTLASAVLPKEYLRFPSRQNRNRNTLGIRDIQSYSGDITLYELATSTSKVKFDSLFSHYNLIDFKSDILGFFTTQKSSFEDEIDISYYILHARPIQAFDLLMQKKGEAFIGSGYLSNVNISIKLPTPPDFVNIRFVPSSPSRSRSKKHTILQLTDDQIQYIKWYCRTLGIMNILNSKVTSSAIIFLELCDIDTRHLRIDFEALRRIYNNYPKNNTPESPIQLDNEDVNVRLQQLIELFISYHKEYSVYEESIITKCLQLLEISTRTMAESHIDSIIPGNKISKWFLVSKYCQIHKLPLSTGQLRELAEQNNWVQFLYEAETQGFPPNQIQNLIENYINNNSLKEHLSLVITNYIRESNYYNLHNNAPWHQFDALNWDHTVLPNPKVSKNLFPLLITARKTVYPAKVILLASLESNRPLLSIVAPTFNKTTTDPSTGKKHLGNVSLLECLITFLLTSSPSTLSSIRKETGVDNICISNVPLSVALHTRSSTLTEDQIKNELPYIITWTADHLFTIALQLCTNQEIQFIIRGFQIFDCDNILLFYLSFHSAILSQQWSIAANCFNIFTQKLTQDHSAPSGIITSRNWAEKLASKMVFILLNSTVNVYELYHLINIVKGSSLLNDLASIISYNLEILDKTSLLTNQNISITSSVQDIINVLANKELFDDAIQYAIKCNVSTDTIVVSKLTNMLRLKSRQWTSTDSNRVKFWDKCSQIMNSSKVTPIAAGNFFEEQLNNLSTSSSITLKEKLKLIELILLHYKNAQEQGSIEYRIEDLENQHLFISTQLTLNKSTLDNNNDNSIIVNKLVNSCLESNNIAQADKICKQYNYFSKDTQIIKYILFVAQGTVSTITKQSISPYLEDTSIINNIQSMTEDNSKTTSDILDYLVTHCSNTTSISCASRIVTNYKISKLLNQSYDNIVAQNPFDLLKVFN